MKDLPNMIARPRILCRILGRIFFMDWNDPTVLKSHTGTYPLDALFDFWVLILLISGDSRIREFESLIDTTS